MRPAAARAPGGWAGFRDASFYNSCSSAASIRRPFPWQPDQKGQPQPELVFAQRIPPGVRVPGPARARAASAPPSAAEAGLRVRLTQPGAGAGTVRADPSQPRHRLSPPQSRRLWAARGSRGVGLGQITVTLPGRPRHPVGGRKRLPAAAPGLPRTPHPAPRTLLLPARPAGSPTPGPWFSPASAGRRSCSGRGQHPGMGRRGLPPAADVGRAGAATLRWGRRCGAEPPGLLLRGATCGPDPCLGTSAIGAALGVTRTPAAPHAALPHREPARGRAAAQADGWMHRCGARVWGTGQSPGDDPPRGPGLWEGTLRPRAVPAALQEGGPGPTALTAGLAHGRGGRGLGAGRPRMARARLVQL